MSGVRFPWRFANWAAVKHPLDDLDADIRDHLERETQENIEIVIDLPGVDPGSVSISVRDGVLRVSGIKRPTTCQHGRAAFHLAEGGFGNFARALRLNAAVDANRASASLVAGELRILLPRVEERRGREIRVAITTP